MSQWIINLKNEYFQLRKANMKKKWFSNKNFLSRLRENDQAYIDLIDEDIIFTDKANNYVKNFIQKENISNEEIKNGILFLKNHISKNKERTKFLILFPSTFTLFLIFEKLDLLQLILPKPFNLIILTFNAFMILFLLSERTKLGTYLHSSEELIDILKLMIK